MEPYQNPKEMEGKVVNLLRQYNVMTKEQVCALFPGQDKAVARALKKLEKNRQLYRNPYSGYLASNEYAYFLKDEGTMCCLWVLADLLKKKSVEIHFLAEKEDFPVRILFWGNEEIYDIMYVGIGDVKLVNGIFGKKKKSGENHIVAVEDKSLIGAIEVPGVIGFCVVKEGGKIEYYRRK
ncbi:MAG: DUF5697 family protein [Monoglobales bacterium]